MVYAWDGQPQRREHPAIHSVLGMLQALCSVIDLILTPRNFESLPYTFD